MHPLYTVSWILDHNKVATDSSLIIAYKLENRGLVYLKWLTPPLVGCLQHAVMSDLRWELWKQTLRMFKSSWEVRGTMGAPVLVEWQLSEEIAAVIVLKFFDFLQSPQSSSYPSASKAHEWWSTSSLDLIIIFYCAFVNLDTKFDHVTSL